MKFLIGLVVGILAALAYSEGLHLSLAKEAEEQLAAIRMPPLYEVQPADVELPVVLTPKPKPEPVEPAPNETAAPPVAEEALPMDRPVPESKTEAEEEAAARTPPFQSAWMPFRSETSATGFAHQLSSHLDRDFEVIKAGPGHYEVGFRFRSEEERDAVLVSIESITGYKVPSS